MRIYLAGPMRGIPEFNFPAFHRYAAILRSFGHVVFSPAENDILLHGGVYDDKTEIFSKRVYFEDDTRWICRYADAIALMPGWENSAGAKVEKALAELLGHKIIYLEKDQ